VSRYPEPAPVHDFVLLFLPPCSPHLTPLATGSLESGLLVSPLLGGPARRRPFAPTLHLHQRKSSRNLHLQYSAKSQSTPRCQSLIIARIDHPPVLGRSGPQWPLKRSAPAPLEQNTTSLEGPSAVPPKLRLARGLDAPSGKLRLARGLDAPSGKTLPRSRVGRPLGRDSASLEGYARPRAGLRLARGSCGPAAPAPTSPTGALNALTRRGRPGQRRIPAMPAH
jgi:hypothetical protein